MPRIYRRYLLLGLLLASALFTVASAGQITYRKAAFRDEFSGPANSPPDPAKWTSEIGGWGWGNQELEYYTDSTDNAYRDGAGSLVIKAVKLSPPLKP